MEITPEEIEEKARELKREYKRAWNRKNKDKVKASQEKYWRKKAAQVIEETTTK